MTVQIPQAGILCLAHILRGTLFAESNQCICKRLQGNLLGNAIIHGLLCRFLCSNTVCRVTALACSSVSRLSRTCALCDKSHADPHTDATAPKPSARYALVPVRDPSRLKAMVQSQELNRHAHGVGATLALKAGNECLSPIYTLAMDMTFTSRVHACESASAITPRGLLPRGGAVGISTGCAGQPPLKSAH